MSAPRRRGACPGLAVPMPTGDGLLARLMPAGPVWLDAFRGLCASARRHGNGTIEVTARGSVQVRGLTEGSAPLFASEVGSLAIDLMDGVAVLVGPLAGADAAPVDPAHIAAELRRALRGSLPALSPKLSVVVDGCGGLHIDAVSADIRLRATDPGSRPSFYVGMAGDGASATWLGTVLPELAVDAVIGLLGIIAAHGSAARASDVLRDGGVIAFQSVMNASLAPSPPPPPRILPDMIGLHPDVDGTVAVGVGLAFGCTQAEALAEVSDIAAASGARGVRPAPDRTLLLLGVPAPRADALVARAERLGFVVRSDDPRRLIAACSGAPSCASGLIPARALAAELAPLLQTEQRAPSGGAIVHISGCLKGCAHPAATPLTIVGTERGYGIVRNGIARAKPDQYIDRAGRLAGCLQNIFHPHPEEAAAAAVSKDGPSSFRASILRDADLRSAPQDELVRHSGDRPLAESPEAITPVGEHGVRALHFVAPRNHDPEALAGVSSDSDLSLEPPHG